MTGPALNHLGQCVTDLTRATRFYVELLGFAVDRELTLPDAAVTPLLHIEPPVGMRAVYLSKGDFQLELMAFDRPGNPEFVERTFTEPGLTHLSFSVDDLAAAVASVEELGGQVVTVLGDAAAMVRDPDGQLVELLPMSFRTGMRSGG